MHHCFTRRQLLQSAACGFGSLALADLLQAASQTESPLPGVAPRAKRVIFLFMAGGPSQHDLFDPKEFLREKHGQKIDSPLRKEVIQIGTEQYLALGAMAPVKPRGESGIMISDLMPHLSSVADELCLMRGMSTDNPQHASATNQFHTMDWGLRIRIYPVSSAFMRRACVRMLLDSCLPNIMERL